MDELALMKKSALPAQSIVAALRCFANQNKTQTESNLMMKIVDARLREASSRVKIVNNVYRVLFRHKAVISI